MILAFTKVCLPLLDYPESEAVQIFTGVLRLSGMLFSMLY